MFHLPEAPIRIYSLTGETKTHVRVEKKAGWSSCSFSGSIHSTSGIYFLTSMYAKFHKLTIANTSMHRVVPSSNVDISRLDDRKAEIGVLNPISIEYTCEAI
jgi:hypothetical protein